MAGLLTPSFWESLATNKGVLQLDKDGNVIIEKDDDKAGEDNNQPKIVAGQFVNNIYPKVICFDLDKGDVGKKSAGLISPLVVTGVKFVIGLIITLFLIVLIIGVFTGWVGYKSTSAKGNTVYDIFYGQDLMFTLGSSLAWLGFVSFILIIIGPITLRKWILFNRQRVGYTNALAANLVACKDNFDKTWEW